MTARKIDGSWWVDFRHVGVRYRKRSPDNSKGGAVAYEMTLRGRLARGEPLQGERAARHVDARFREFANRWYDTCSIPNDKPSERAKKRQVLDGHLFPELGHLRLSEIRGQLVEQYKGRKLEAGYNPKSINNQLAVLSGSLRAAVEWNELATLPSIRRLKTTLPPPRFLRPSEVEQVVLAAETGPRSAMVRLAADSGLRLGELLGLQWSDIDFDRGQFCVQRSIWKGIVCTTKTHKIRHVGLSAAAHKALVTLGARAEGFVFARDDGRPGAESTADRFLRRAARRAGIRALGWHVLRHTFASTLASRGVPLYTIEKLLGHSSPAMTQRYAHLAPDTLRDAIRVLDAPEGLPSYPNFGQPVGRVPPGEDAAEESRAA